jgi:hypothetical protein
MAVFWYINCGCDLGLWLRGRASDWQSEGRGFESPQLHTIGIVFLIYRNRRNLRYK